jgi:hypothetical protein
MLSLNIPQQIQIKITEDYIIIEGPLGIKKKKKSKDLNLFFDPNKNKL